MLGNLIATSNTDVNATLANEGGNIGGRKEDKGDGEVLDQRNVKTGFAAELNIRTGEEVQSRLLKATLCRWRVLVCAVSGLFRDMRIEGAVTRRVESSGVLAFRDSEEKSSFKAEAES